MPINYETLIFGDIFLEDYGRFSSAEKHQIRDLQASWRRPLAEVRAPVLFLRLADKLFDSPVLTVVQAQQLLSVSNRSARPNVERLVSLAILEPVSDASYGKVYAAPDVLRLSQEMATLAGIDIADLDGINPGIGSIPKYRSDPNFLVAVGTRFVVRRG